MAIFFDLDGTLVDTCQDIIIAINNLCRELNRPEAHHQLLIDHVSFGIEKILQVALNIKIADLSESELIKLKNKFKELYKQSKFKSSKVFPGLNLLITDLKKKGIKVAVVTNKPAEFAIPILEQVNLINQMDCVVTSDMVLNPKPAPDLVLLAINKLKADPKKCLFIGDAEQDIIAGNAAGVKTIAALFGYVGDINTALNWPANYFVNKSTDLLSLINKIY